ncbi:hypothetical protein NAU58_20940 [Pseudomonas stutzeri]|uniref:hypothetical protein n=1 Tax=Stutzerimonas stutzeri TaxID=316 RepID=UPI0015E1916D|nr:hypothetical protein [Stutzerimonas stutzeri]MCQ4298048.1 hypothetical protein [Stutzerimonas stutzeri]
MNALRAVTQDIYAELMAKKANKHTDPINNKTDAGKIKPCGYAVANIWPFYAKSILKAILMHSTETIEGVM